MPSTKPFLNYEQQLDKLIYEKNLVIGDRNYAEKFLKQIGYFTLVSGYKELFRNPTTKKYKDGTTFEEIVALYKFDASLRELFLKHLLIIEQKMRSLLSYYFTEYYGEGQVHYLSRASYNYIPKHATGIDRLIDTLRNIALKSTDYHYITHQRNKHGNTPLWVLIKVLTFGNMVYMYQYLPQKLRISISKNFDKTNEKELFQYLRVLTKFRNVCAHNERLFSYRTRDNIPDTTIHAKLGILKKGSQFTCGKNDLYSVVIAFRFLLEREDFKHFKNRLGRTIEQFVSKTTNITEGELLVEMGFPKNWKKISAYKI
jgi:abortive infection bacteriophage resistance protein